MIMPRQKAEAAPAPRAPAPRLRWARPPGPNDWFGAIGDDRYPLALQRWAAFGPRGGRYHDPRTAAGKAATPIDADYADALRLGAVVLMRSTETRGAGGVVAHKREGAIGLYRIANVEIGEDGVRFDFVERLGVF
jgi:hypothetical protein